MKRISKKTQPMKLKQIKEGNEYIVSKILRFSHHFTPGEKVTVLKIENKDSIICQNKKMLQYLSIEQLIEIPNETK